MDDEMAHVLQAMEAEMGQSPAPYQPARFWRRLNAVHDAQLGTSGFHSFKRTINQAYYNWLLGVRDPQVRALANWWVRHPSPRVAGASIDDWRGFESQKGQNPLRHWHRRLIYATAVATIWELARRKDDLGLLNLVNEPSLGDPIVVKYRGRRISQDLVNSTLELYAIAEAAGALEPGPRGVIELGAGYGRLAWLYLSAFPRVRYLIADIPPALAIAQTYLTNLFPERSVFRFRHFDQYGAVAEEFEKANLLFITPNQLELIPPQHASIFVNISSLHEMRPDQIANYLDLIGQHTRGVFYTKQWWRWTNPDDGVTISQTDYPIPSEWAPLYLRSHPVQHRLFEAAYLISSDE